MRCLYCGKELALLKRLTGNGEFCSDQHKQSYHDEYNRLALSRLLQAQTKTDEGRAKSAKSAGGTATPAEAPSTKRERGPALPVPVAHKAEPVATATAGFLPAPLAIVDCPHPAVISPSTPYSWIPSPVLPAFSQVQPLAIETAQEDPPVAGLLEFTMAPLRQTGLNPVQMSEAGPFESTHNVYPRREGTVKRESFDLGMAGPVAMPGISVVAPVAPELSLVDSQPFFPEVFQLLTPPPAQESPDLPAESAAVQVADGNLGLTEEAFELDHALPPEIEPPDIENVEKEHGKQPKLEEPDTSDAEGLGRLQTGLRSRPEPGRVGREWGGGRRTELPVVSGPVVDSLALQSLIP